MTSNRFQIGSEIGYGGRGQVYRGLDTWLERDVALKFLREEFAADPNERRRFELEAKYLAKLDHENIVRVYDRVELDGKFAMVMEFVRGTSLKYRIDPRRAGRVEEDWKRSRRAKGLSVRESVNIASQIASALSAAHDLGLVHRDVKPGNVMIRPDNHVKVLDFGLSKLGPRTAEGSHETSTTETMVTPIGGIPGTLAYMAPERLQGQVATAQADQFSLAVVVFEMFTGQRPFSGRPPDLIRAIVSERPTWPASFLEKWPDLVQVVNRGLSKDPRDRYASVLAFSAALERGLNTSADLPKRPAISVWVASAVVVVSALLAVGMFASKLVPPVQPTISPDAQVVSFLAEPVLQLDQVDLIDSPSLPTGGGAVFTSHESGYWHVARQVVSPLKPYDLMPNLHCDSTQPAVSPDGFLIALRSECDGGGVFVLDSASVGGKRQRITERGAYPAWSPDSHELSYSGPSGLYTVRIGGEPHLIQSGDTYQSSWSPNGKRIAYAAFVNGQHDIFTVSPGEAPIRVTNDRAIDVQPAWNRATNSLCFLSNKTGRRAIWCVAISESTGLVEGNPHLEKVGRGRDIASFSISANGTFIFVEQTGSSTIEKAVLMHGPEVSLGRATQVAEIPGISPAGIDLFFGPNSLAVYASEPEKNIVLYDLMRNRERPLIADGYTNRHPRISRDGTTVAYDSLHNGVSDVYLVDVRTGRTEPFSSEPDSGANTPVWSPDGHTVAVSLSNGSSGMVDVRTPLHARKIVRLPALNADPGCSFGPSSYSSDGKALAGSSLCRNGLSRGIRLYDSNSGEYQRISTSGRTPVFIDARTIGFTDGGALHYVEVHQNATVRALYSLAPDVLAPGFTVSPDGSELYYMRFKPKSYLFTQSMKSFGVTQTIATPH